MTLARKLKQGFGKRLEMASDNRVTSVQVKAIIARDLAKNPRNDYMFRKLTLGEEMDPEMGRDRLKLIKRRAKRLDSKAKRVTKRHETGWIGRLKKWLGT